MPEKLEGAVKLDVSKAGEVPKPKCKPCCACPETRKARDACIMERGESNCEDAITAHKTCMKEMGFNI